MGLGRDKIHTWDQMMKKFLEKYQDYDKYKERREEVCRMMQHKDDILENYVKRCNYNLQRERKGYLSLETQCVLFMIGFWDDCVELLNLMVGGDGSQLEYDTILEIYRKYSRRNSKTCIGPRDILARNGKTGRGGFTREEIINMIGYFKTYILISMSS